MAPTWYDDFLKNQDPIVLYEVGESAFFNYGVFDPFGPIIGTIQEHVLDIVELKEWVKKCPWRFNLERIFKKIYASTIANGHAWDKHVIKRREFEEIGIFFATREEFNDFIFDIMQNPDDYAKLKNNRDIFWDNETGTIVIRDPANPDGGTCFRPKDGKAYFDELKSEEGI